MDGNSGTGPEINPTPLPTTESDSFGGEKRPSRETVINTFNSAFDFFQQTPSEELNPEELAARDHLTEIKAKTIDQGKDSYIKTFTGQDGKKYTQTEHLPIEGLTSFLSKKHAEAVRDGNEDLQANLKKHLMILLEKKIGVPYVRVPRRRMADPKYNARVMAELDRIQKDPRLSSGNDSIDYFRANEILTKRWELILPKDSKNGIDIEVPALPSTAGEVVLPDNSEQEEKVREFWKDADPEKAQKLKDMWRNEISKVLTNESRTTTIQNLTDSMLDNLEKTHAAYSQFASELGYDCTFKIDRSTSTVTKEIKKKETVPSSSEVEIHETDDEKYKRIASEMTAIDNIYDAMDRHSQVNFNDAVDAYLTDGTLPDDEETKNLVLREVKNENDFVKLLPPDLAKEDSELCKIFYGWNSDVQKLVRKAVDTYLTDGTLPDDEETKNFILRATDYGKKRDEIEPWVKGSLKGFMGVISDDLKDQPIPTPPTPNHAAVLEDTGRIEPVGEIPSGMVAEAMGEAPQVPPIEAAQPSLEITQEDLAPTDTSTDGAVADTEPEPEAEAELTPPTIEEVIKEYSVMIGNRTEDIRKHAAELAEKHLRAEQRKGKLLNPLSWARKTKLRVLEEYYRQKYTREITQAMLENKNSLMGYDFATKAAINTAAEIEKGKAEGKAKIEQLKTGELIEGQKVAPVDGEIRNKIIAEFIKPITEGTLTDEKELQDKLKAFVARDDIKDDPRIIDLFGNKSTQYGMKADFFATDLLEMGRQIKADKEAHGFSLTQMDSHIKIQLANTSWAAETQVKWSMADKAIAWSQRNDKRGWLTNPAVIGAVTSIGLYGGMRAAGYSGKALLAAAPGAGLLVGASFAAVRRAHDLKVDRAAHQVEMAYGSQLPEQDAKRRRSLEKFALESTSVNTLLGGGVERTTVGGDTRGMRELMDLDLTTVENRQALMQRVSEIRTRLDYSASQKIDLITYQSRETVEQGRLQLIKAVAEAKKKLLDAGVTQDQMTNELGNLYGQWSAQFLTNRESQDKAFNRYRVKQSLISAGIGGASGLAIGLGAGFVAREVMEHTVGNTHISGLEKVPGLNKLTGKHEDTKDQLQSLSSEKKPLQVGDLTISMDDNNHIITTTPDGISQVHENWTLADNGHIKITGEVPQEIKDEFKMEGFDVSENVDKEPFSFDPTVPPDQDQLPGLQHQSYVPHGTGWVQDTEDPTKWDLVVNQRPDLVLIHDASVTPDGQSITYDASHSAFGENAFANNRIVEIEPARIESKDVFGPEGLWEKNGTPIDHREWYGNNTKYSDLNELRAYNSVFTANGQKGIDWDMSHMQPGGSFQDGNHPPSVNVQEVIGQGKAAIAFSTPDHQGNPIIITDDSDAWIDGHFRLDPTDTVHHINADPNSMTVAEFSKLVVDQQKLSSFPDGSLASELTGHQDLFTLGKDGKPGFIETGRLVDIDGKKVFQPFATAQGTGGAPATLDIEVPAKTDMVIDVIPKTVEFDHTVTEIIPPSDHEIPFVPWAVSPRYPLEGLETAPPPSPYGRPYGRRRSGEAPPTPPPDMPEVFTPAEEVLGEEGTTTTPAPTAPSSPRPPETPASNPTQPAIASFISNEATSPVELSDRIKAIERGNEFVESSEIKDAEEKGGLTKEKAAALYTNILTWLQSTNIVDAEKEDPTFDTSIYASLIESLKTYNGTSDENDVKASANVLARFMRESSIDIGTGDIGTNSYALAFLYDLVKDLKLK